MKRFTESRKWDNPWYRQLAPRLKLLWLWLCDSCDPAGVLKPDWGLASFQIGEVVSAADLGEFEGKAKALPGGKLLLVPFIAFQYGKLSPDCKPHRPIFASLQKHNISLQELEGYQEFPIEYPKGINTLQDKDKEKDKEKEGLEVQEEGGSEEGIPPVTLEAAKANAGQHQATPDIAEKWWLDQDARGWLDGRGQPITKPWSHLRSYAISWRSNDAKRANQGSRFSRPEESISTATREPGYDF